MSHLSDSGLSPASTASAGIMSLTDEELDYRIDLLIAIWKHDTMLSSAVNHDHFSYVNVVEMGERVIPFLLRRLQNRQIGIQWIGAVAHLAGEIPRHYLPSKPNSRQTIAGWVQWGIDQGHLQPSPEHKDGELCPS